jgi:hypothetical protein
MAYGQLPRTNGPHWLVRLELSRRLSVGPGLCATGGPAAVRCPEPSRVASHIRRGDRPAAVPAEGLDPELTPALLRFEIPFVAL